MRANCLAGIIGKTRREAGQIIEGGQTVNNGNTLYLGATAVHPRSLTRGNSGKRTKHMTENRFK